MRITPLVLVLALCVSVAAQEPIRFEAASVKVSPPPEYPNRRVPPRAPDLFARNFTTLEQLVTYAYDLPAFRVAGLPAWATSEHYDVMARANGPQTFSQMRALVRDWLAERFALKTHLETKEATTYALVLARADGRLGPGLKEASDCTPVLEAQRASYTVPAIPDRCNLVRWGTNMRTGATTRSTAGLTMPRVAEFVSSVVQAPVVDHTGLTRAFDIEISYVGDPVMSVPGLPRPTEEGPTFRSALTEQLGLKLEPVKAPIDILVIDAASRPAPD